MKKILLSAMLFCGATVIASELWLWPQRFHFEPGETAIITQRTGNLYASSTAYNNTIISNISTHYLPNKQVNHLPVTQSNNEPNTVILTDLPSGTHMLTHASSSDTMEVTTDTLKAYFKYQQLSTHPLTAATVVRWHNCAKTIFQVGAPITNNLTVNVMQPTTLTLDIIPITHPQQPTADNTSYSCEFQVNFNGTALANQIIEVWHSNAASPQKLTTNRKGRVTVTIAKGHYMLTTYHSLLATNTPKPMVEAYFGSLTLSTPKGNIFLKRSSKN
jgi:hypothetical protein